MIDEVQEGYMALMAEVIAKGDSVSQNLKTMTNKASDKMAQFGSKDIVFLSGTDWKHFRD